MWTSPVRLVLRVPAASQILEASAQVALARVR